MSLFDWIVDLILPTAEILKVILIIILGVVTVCAMKFLPKGKAAAFIIGLILIVFVWVYEF